MNGFGDGLPPEVHITIRCIVYRRYAPKLKHFGLHYKNLDYAYSERPLNLGVKGRMLEQHMN